jgi:hypothetical protein
MPKLTPQEFDDVVGRVINSVPDGTDDATLESLLDQELSKAEAAKYEPETPEARRERYAGMWPDDGPELGENIPSAVAAIAAGPGAGVLAPIARAAVGGGLAKGAESLVQGKGMAGAAEDAAETGVLEGLFQAIPGVPAGGVRKFGEVLERNAPAMVQRGLKPVFEYVQRRSKQEGRPLEETAEDISRFIADEQLATPAAARKVTDEAGQDIDRVTAAAERQRPGMRSDLPARVPKYAESELQRIFETEKIPGPSTAGFQDRISKTVNEPSWMNRPTRSPDVNAKPLATPVRPLESHMADVIDELRRVDTVNDVPPTRLRAPDEGQQYAGRGGRYRNPTEPKYEIRDDITPSELLKHNRGDKSAFDPNAKLGDERADKALELATRDSFKDMVPMAVPHLQRQGRALDAETVLDRAAWRDANRDAVGLGPIAMLANKGGLTGVAAAALMRMAKEGQLRGGLLAAKHGPRMATRNEAVSPELLSNAIRSLLARLSGGDAAADEPDQQ